MNAITIQNVELPVIEIEVTANEIRRQLLGDGVTDRYPKGILLTESGYRDAANMTRNLRVNQKGTLPVSMLR